MPDYDHPYQTVMSKNHAFDIITYIYEKGTVHKSDLYAVSSNYRAFSSTLKVLVDEGLVIEEMTREPRLHYTLSLSEKGKRVGKCLMDAKKILVE